MRDAVAVVAVFLMLTTGADQAWAESEAPAGPVEIPSGGTRCAFDAWASFRADAPISVRAEPASSAAVLGYLPVAGEGADEVAGVEFAVTEARPGWLRIDHAMDPVDQDDEGRPVSPRAVYQQAGWIPDDMAQFGIQSALGYARPDASSPLVLDLDGDWLTDMAQVSAVRGCSGEWVLVDYRVHVYRTGTGALVEIPDDEQKEGTAWFRGLCANQYTTCDMSSVDRRS